MNMNKLFECQKGSMIKLLAFSALNPDVDINKVNFSKTTAEEVDEAEKELAEWLKKAFPGRDSASIEKANEAFFATTSSWAAARQEAFESGMMMGARLMFELMGVSLNRG